MNPNPNLMAQLIVVVPIILAYQVGVLLVWLTNRGRPTNEQLSKLRGQDEELRAVRLQTAKKAKPVQPVLANIPVKPYPAQAVAAHAVKARPAVSVRPGDITPVKKIVATPKQAAPRPVPQRRYISDFAPRRTNYTTIRPLANTD
jgi:hypothetical protein